MSDQAPRYYVPHTSYWPIVGAVSLFVAAFGAATFIHETTEFVGAETQYGEWVFYIGLIMVACMMFGWFKDVVSENVRGMMSGLMDVSYRQSMAWFIASEVFFFGAFFGALFYARLWSVPWLAGAGNNLWTNTLLHPDFADTWPLFLTPDGTETQTMGAWGLPFINTLILVTSSVTVTFSHWALKKRDRIVAGAWLALTVGLGVVFLILQVVEYIHAFDDLGLTSVSYTHLTLPTKA